MVMVMCRSCGTFVAATRPDGAFKPAVPECPECGGTSFKHYASGEIIDVN